MYNHVYVGKENAKKAFNKKANRWEVYWFDVDGIRHNSTYAKWWWETNKGIVPEGYRASYRDGNALNIDPDNIVLISREEFGSRISKRLMGHGFSDETLKKMSDAKTGKPLSEEHKAHIGKATKQMWKDGVFDAPEIRAVFAKSGRSTKGSKRTEEQKEKQSKRQRKFYSEHPEVLETISSRMKNREISDETRKNLSVATRKRVENGTHNWWKGGASYRGYPQEFNQYLKGKIKRRDKHTCQICGVNVFNSKLGCVHHIDANKQNNAEDNLILLCATCHNAVHGRSSLRIERILEFQNKLKY